MKSTLFGLAALLLAGAAAAEAAGSLTLTFDTGTTDGHVMVAVYNSQSAFDGEGAPVRAVRGKPGETLRVDGLAPGRYGIKAFHDVNGDGKLNMNPFGMPIEPYAFSNNARGHMGPAKWADAAFEVKAAGASQRLVLK